MQQFAADMEEQLGQDIPQEIRNDPERYEAFVQQKLAEQLAKPDTDLARRAESLFSSNAPSQSRGGKAGFLERLKRGAIGKGNAIPIRATSTRIKVHKVGDSSQRAGLLDDQDREYL